MASDAEIRAAAEKHPQLKVVFKDAQNDTLKQRAHVEEFVSAGVDLIIISPKEAQPLTQPVAKAVDAGAVARQCADRGAIPQRVHAARVAAGGACWLDVRYAAEFVEDGLPGAINVPLNEIRSAFEVLDPGREYIAYCRRGRRSSAAAFLLAQHGFRAVWLEGGLEGKGTDK